MANGQSGTQVGIKGKGNPNKIIQRDYGGFGNTGWEVRIETIVPIPDGDFDQVRTLLASSASTDMETLARLLVPLVPSGHPARVDAQHMVAAAFGWDVDHGGIVIQRRA